MVSPTGKPGILINYEGFYCTGMFIVNKTIIKKRPCAMVPSVIHESCEQSLGNGQCVDDGHVHLGYKVHEIWVVAVGVRGIPL